MECVQRVSKFKHWINGTSELSDVELSAVDCMVKLWSTKWKCAVTLQKFGGGLPSSNEP